jgi:MFS family permease
MFVGVTGIMIAGLQPLLLGGLAQEGRLTAAELGQTATAELLTMGLTAALAGVLLRPARLKIIAIAALIALAVIDTLTPLARGEMVTLARAAAGVPSGVLIWVTISMIARSPTPERWSGAYLTVQTLAQFLLATFLTAFIVPRYGADGGFIALALFCLVNVAATLLLPAEFAPLARQESGGRLPNARGWAALAVSFLYIAFTIGVWVYAEPLSRQAGHGSAIAGQAVSLSLACQVAGGFAATALAGRINWLATLLVCALVNLALFAGFAVLPGPTVFLALAGVFGFVWLFASPFLVPMTIEADPTRRAAVLMGGVQLVGGSFGPLFASFFVTDADARGALGFGAASLVLAMGIVLALYQTRARGAAVEAAP